MTIRGLGRGGFGGVRGLDGLSWVISAEVTYNQCVQHDSVVL